jgi:hypothetical protein
MVILSGSKTTLALFYFLFNSSLEQNYKIEASIRFSLFATPTFLKKETNAAGG